MNRLKKQLARLGILQKDIDKAKSIEELNKLKKKFLKNNGAGDATDTEGE